MRLISISLPSFQNEMCSSTFELVRERLDRILHPRVTSPSDYNFNLLPSTWSDYRGPQFSNLPRQIPYIDNSTNNFLRMIKSESESQNEKFQENCLRTLTLWQDYRETLADLIQHKNLSSSLTNHL